MLRCATAAPARAVATGPFVIQQSFARPSYSTAALHVTVAVVNALPQRVHGVATIEPWSDCITSCV